MGSVRVLYVGRDDENVAALEARDARFEVAAEPTVERALDRFDEWRPDCLFAAYDLPERTGIDLLAAVRERSETVPFLLLGRSGRVAEEALASGVTDFVSTDAGGPDPAVLAHRILNYTDRARRRTDLVRYETVVEALGDPVYVLDDEGRFTYVNDAFLDLVGYDETTVLGATPDLIKGPEAVETAETELGRLLSSDGPDSVTFEVDIRPADGAPVRCEDHMGVLTDEAGRFRGSAGVLRDVSERVERKRRIRAERRLLDRSIDTLDDIYYLLDPSGEIERYNATFAEVTGYEDPEGMNALELFEGADRERVAAAIDEVVDTGSTRIEAQLVTSDGRQIPYDFTGTRLLDESGSLRGIIGIGRDVSERAAYEATLERKNERLEEFASVVSHDLRNPLNVAQGRLDLIREEYDGDHVDAVARSLDRMDALIDDLLALAREGESVDEVSPVSLRRTVEASWDSVDTADAALDVRTDAVVVADEMRLRQLVENLVTNAVEHAGPAVTVTVGELGDASGFYVADDGPGIPADEREQVFEHGYSTTREGTGFGLAIVESVASAHGWETTLVESEGGGARFEFGGVEFAERKE